MNFATPMKSLLKNPEKGYVLVAGLGVSGVAIARFLRSKNLDVVATDRQIQGAGVTDGLEALGVRCETGGHKAQTFERAELIVTSPGIPLDMEFFKLARARGVLITGELDLFSFFLTKPLVAITGTNGKTTVTTLISEMLKQSGLNVFTGGNIGIPLVKFLEDGQKQDVVVAEISSFQLDAARSFSPDVGVLLNIAQDHMDRYTDFFAYIKSKLGIFNNQSKDSFAIVNQTLSSQPHYQETDWKKSIPGTLLTFGDSSMDCMAGGADTCNACIYTTSIDIKTKTDHFILDLSSSRLRGAHNRENIAGAALAALAMGGTQVGIQRAVNQFSGLAHRTEFVATINGVEYYDDSKGTNPHAVEGALKGFDRVILILGGRSKGTDFTRLIPIINQRVKAVILMGEAAQEIKDALIGAIMGLTVEPTIEIMTADSMAHAVSLGRDFAVKGDTVLLSPGCSSFDMYDNYAARGKDFKDQVMKLNQETP